MKKIGVLGSSFNPPTLGHQDVVNQALPHFDEILLVPSVAHAFGKSMAPLNDRLEMLRLFTESFPAHASVKIFNIETSMQDRIGKDKPIYTFDMLMELEAYYQALHQSITLHFILGPDNASPDIWKKFYRFDDIEKKWERFVAKEQLKIRSSEVRALSEKPLEPHLLLNELTSLVGESVARYIISHQLYKHTLPTLA